MTTWREDAHTVGAFTRGGDWACGHLVVRRPNEVTVKEFAKEAALHPSTVLKYEKAWNLAAADGLVPESINVSPDTLIKWEHLDDATWEVYYRQALVAEDGARGGALEKRKGARRHLGAKKLVEAVAEDPKLVAQVLRTVREKRDAERAALIEAQADDDLHAVANGGRGPEGDGIEPIDTGKFDLLADKVARKEAILAYCNASHALEKAVEGLSEYSFGIPGEVGALRESNERINIALWDVESRIVEVNTDA